MATQAFAATVGVDELVPNSPVAIDAAVTGEPLCVVSDGENISAFVNACPHRGHELSAGSCSEGILRCALHGWEFRLSDGAAVAPAAPFGLELRRSRVRDGAVEVEVRR